MATAGTDGTVRLWDAKTGEEILTLAGYAGPIEHLVFSPDARMLAGEGSMTTRLWLLDTADLLALAKRRITRSLTVSECLKYLGESPCPPLL
jgi:WD40 repeat protein